MTTIIIHLALRILSWLPLEVARWIGRRLGDGVWLFNLREKKIALTNIRLAFPSLSDKEQYELARSSVRSAGEWFCELGKVWVGSLEQLEAMAVTIQGLELVEAAKAQSKGVIILAPHLGNWEFAGLYLNKTLPLACLYEPPNVVGLESLMVSRRTRSGMSLYPTTAKGIVGLTRVLKAGGGIGILPDQVPRDLSSGCNAEFMAHSCFTQTLGLKLAQRTGAAVLFLVAYRVPQGFSVHITKAPELVSTGDTTDAATAMNKAIEELLRDYPEQYQWTYKRFRVRPQQGVNHYH